MYRADVPDEAKLRRENGITRMEEPWRFNAWDDAKVILFLCSIYRSSFSDTDLTYILIYIYIYTYTRIYIYIFFSSIGSSRISRLILTLKQQPAILWFLCKLARHSPLTRALSHLRPYSETREKHFSTTVPPAREEGSHRVPAVYKSESSNQLRQTEITERKRKKRKVKKQKKKEKEKE